MKYRMIIIIAIGILCLTHSVSAQELNAYYKSDKAYVDAKLNGLTIQEKEGKYGFTNTKGKFVIKPIFDEVKEFTNELAIIKYNGGWGMIDLHGNTIIQPKYKFGPLRLTYNLTPETQIVQCDIFRIGLNTDMVAVLYYKNGTYNVLNIQSHIKKDAYDFLIADMPSETLKQKGVAYGRTFIIKNDGTLTSADAMSSLVDVNNIAMKKGSDWVVFNIKCEETIVLPKYTDLLAVRRIGFIFRNTSTDTYSYIYRDKSKENFVLIKNAYGAPQESLFGNLTCIGCVGRDGTESFIVLNKSNAEIADNILSFKTIINGLVELTHWGGRKSLVNKEGKIITNSSMAFHKIAGNYIIVNQQHYLEQQAEMILGYGIIDSNGNILVPPVLEEKDIIINKDKYLIYGRHCTNQNFIFASSDGWYQEISVDNTTDLGKAVATYASKLDLNPNDAVAMKFWLSPSYKLCRHYANTQWGGKRWFREETFNDVIYTQPVLGLFYDKKNVHIGTLESVRNELHAMNNITGEFISVGPYDSYIICRMNEEGTPYLKIKDSEFDLCRLAQLLHGEKVDISINSISPSVAQDVIEAIYGEKGKMIPKRLGKLSDGKMLLKLESQGIVNLSTYISANVWYSLGRSVQKNLENIAHQTAAEKARTMQSNLVLLDIEKSEITKIIIIDSHYDPKYEEDYDIVVGRDGFYLFNSMYLARFNNEGDLLWEYGHDPANYLTAFDENESQVIIIGYNSAEKYYGRANPMTILINKETGDIISREVENCIIEGKVNPYWDNVVFIDNGYILQREDAKATNDNKYITKIVTL